MCWALNLCKQGAEASAYIKHMSHKYMAYFRSTKARDECGTGENVQMTENELQSGWLRRLNGWMDFLI
jgi:hypothetical protein